MYQALPRCLHVKDSSVAGQGLFALEDIPDDVYLGISHVVVDEDIMRTPLGGFVNHSETPNCVKVFEKEEWGKIYHMRTIRPIKKGEELFLKYTFYEVAK
jgi:SET domain-containing protein